MLLSSARPICGRQGGGLASLTTWALHGHIGELCLSCVSTACLHLHPKGHNVHGRAPWLAGWTPRTPAPDRTPADQGVKSTSREVNVLVGRRCRMRMPLCACAAGRCGGVGCTAAYKVRPWCAVCIVHRGDGAWCMATIIWLHAEVRALVRHQARCCVDFTCSVNVKMYVLYMA